MNDYESHRRPAKQVKVMNEQDRLNLLTFEWNVSLHDIANACTETRIARQQRQETKMQTFIQRRAEEFVEYAKDFSKKKKTNDA